ncbi:hypothetical protein B0H19DRAFT_1081661 [Mycena capillaripes]|nr:hypothetical protein B0H19DRAFT_1081661 [Mycena capillaripes]
MSLILVAAQISETADPVDYGGAPTIVQEPGHSQRRSTQSFDKKQAHRAIDQEMLTKDTEDVSTTPKRDGAQGLLILGWCISATTLQATRHRWIVQTLFAWFFISILAFRFIPNSVVARPVSVIWKPLIRESWYKLPNSTRLAIGWLSLLGIIFGSAFAIHKGTPTTTQI